MGKRNARIRFTIILILSRIFSLDQNYLILIFIIFFNPFFDTAILSKLGKGKKELKLVE